jgi:fatty acid desaturase
MWDVIDIVMTIVFLGGLLAAGAVSGWLAARQWRTRPIALAGGVAIAVCATLLVVAIAGTRAGDANIGAGLLMFPLLVAVGGTVGALARSVRHRRPGG